MAHRPLLVDLTIEEGTRLKVIYGSAEGFHAIDLDSSTVYDIYIPKHVRHWIYLIRPITDSDTLFPFDFFFQIQNSITPHTIVTLPNSNGMQLLLCYDNEGVYVNTSGKVICQRESISCDQCLIDCSISV